MDVDQPAPAKQQAGSKKSGAAGGKKGAGGGAKGVGGSGKASGAKRKKAAEAEGEGSDEGAGGAAVEQQQGPKYGTVKVHDAPGGWGGLGDGGGSTLATACACGVVGCARCGGRGHVWCWQLRGLSPSLPCRSRSC